jgi:hypothetical protein
MKSYMMDDSGFYTVLNGNKVRHISVNIPLFLTREKIHESRRLQSIKSVFSKLKALIYSSVTKILYHIKS